MLSDLPGWQRLIAGGFSGVISWSIGYPMNVVKSRIQTIILDRPLSVVPDGTAFREAARIYSAGGVPGFFSGHVVTMTRAFLVNAITFWLWEYSKATFSLRK